MRATWLVHAVCAILATGLAIPIATGSHSGVGLRSLCPEDFGEPQCAAQNLCGENTLDCTLQEYGQPWWCCMTTGGG